MDDLLSDMQDMHIGADYLEIMNEPVGTDAIESELEDCDEEDDSQEVPFTSLQQWNSKLGKEGFKKSKLTLNDIKIDRVSTDEDFLKNALSEFEQVKANIQGKDVIHDLFVKPMFDFTKKYVEMGVMMAGKEARAESTSPPRRPSDDQILRFLQTILKLCWYEVSIETLFSKESKVMVGDLPLRKKDFKEIQRLLLLGMGEGDDQLRSIKDLFRFVEPLWRSVLMTNATKLITIDDDKQNSRSSKWDEIGVSMKMIKKNYGAIVHAALSTCTGGILSLKLEQKIDSELSCVQSLLRRIYQCDTDEELAEEVQKQDPCVFFDRGYMKGEALRWVLKTGFDLLGTEAHTNGSAFIKTEKEYNDTKLIPVKPEGMYTAYWVESKYPVLRTSSRRSKETTLYSMCARSGYKGYIRACTNLKKVQPNRWVLYHPRTVNYDPKPLDDCDSELIKRYLDQFLSRIHVLTADQGDDGIWRYLRYFRISSTVACHLFTYYTKVPIPEPICSLTNGDAVTHFTNTFTLFDCKTEFEVEDNPEKKDERLLQQLDHLKAKELKALCKKLKVSQTGVKSVLKDRLFSEYKKRGSLKGDDADSNIDLPLPGSTEKSLEMKLFGSWFMSQPRERSERDSLRIGKQAEPKTIANLASFLEENSGIRVEHQLPLGLVASQLKPWFVSSLDQLLLFREIPSLFDDDEDPLNPQFSTLRVAAVEAKAKTTEDTLSEELDLLDEQVVQKFEKVELSAADLSKSCLELKRVIPNKNYRIQVIHHMAVSKLDSCFFVVSDSNGDILRVCLIICDSILLGNYCYVMTCVYNQHLKVYHEGTEEEVIKHLDALEAKNNSFGYAVDGFSVFQRLQVAKKLLQYCKKHYMERRCPPSKARLILPKVVCEWNRHKNSIDVMSRLISEVEPDIGNGCPAFRMYIRIFISCIVNLYRIFQIESVLPKLKEGRIKTITALNHERSKSRTMKSTVANLYAGMPRFFSGEPEYNAEYIEVKEVVRERRTFETAQEQGSATYATRLNTSLTHEIVKVDKRGTCKFCCRVCTKDEEKTVHTREGNHVSTKCKDCNVFLCTKAVRYPGVDGCETSTCFTLFHELKEGFPTFCKDVAKQRELKGSVTKKQLETGRKSTKSRSTPSSAQATVGGRNSNNNSTPESAQLVRTRRSTASVNGQAPTPRKRQPKRVNQRNENTSINVKRRDPSKQTPVRITRSKQKKD